MTNLNSFFEYLAASIKVDERQIARIQENLSVISDDADGYYVLRRRSPIQARLLRAVCARFKLPRPRIKSDENGWKILFLRNYTGHELTLRHTQSYRRSLLKQLRTMDEAAPSPRCLPVTFSAGLGPQPWPAPTRLPIDFAFLPAADIWLLGVYFAHRKNLALDIGPLLEIGPQATATERRHRLFLELYRKEKLTRGAKDNQQHTVESIVLSGRRFEKELLLLAETTSDSRDELYARAKQNFAEIAATMNGRTIRAMRFILKPFVNAAFQRIEVRNIERLRDIAGTHPTAILPSHRSHFDYLLVGWILYHANLPIPYVAAGENLNFFPAGKFIKAAGGFFIRRTTRGDRLYRLVLDNYLSYLIKRGHLLGFYLEGGRSRSGGMRSPKLGLLKYLVRAWEEGGREDIHMVPIGISYERIAEEKAMIAELSGAGKRKESFFELLKVRRILRRRFGSVLFCVGEPFSLKAFRTVSPSGAPNTGLLTEDLAFAVSRRIMQCTGITGTALAATAVSTFPGYSFSEDVLTTRMTELLRVLLVLNGVPDSARWFSESPAPALNAGERTGTIELSSLLIEQLSALPPKRAMAHVLAEIQAFGFLLPEDGVEAESSRGVFVPKSAQLALVYYKNNILHFFIPVALMAQALENQTTSFVSVLHTLHQLFKPAFLLPHWRSWRAEVFERLNLLAAEGWLEAEAVLGEHHAEETPRVALSPLGAAPLSALTWLLRPYFEVLYAAVSVVVDTTVFRLERRRMLELIKESLSNPALLDFEPQVESGATSLLDFALQSLETLGFVLPVDGFENQQRASGVGSHYAFLPSKDGKLEEVREFLLTQLRLLDAQHRSKQFS